MAINRGETDNGILKHLTNLVSVYSFLRNFAPVPEQSRRRDSSVLRGSSSDSMRTIVCRRSRLLASLRVMLMSQVPNLASVLKVG